MNAAWHLIDYDREGWKEPQFTEYHAPGGLYREHADTFFEGKDVQRKVSVTVLLSDPDTYEGGDLHIGGQPVDMQHGDIAVFPSVVQHTTPPGDGRIPEQSGMLVRRTRMEVTR